MAGQLFTFVLAFAGLFVCSKAICTNALAIYNPTLRTMAGNNVWFLVLVEKQKVMTALNEAYPGNDLTKKLTLLNASSIPGTKDVFASNMHPILTVNGLSDDIRLSTLQISGSLLSSSTMVPLVSYKGSKKPMLAPLNGYIGGVNRGTFIDKLRLAGFLPAFVSSFLLGIELRVGDFLPANAAWECNGNSQCFANSKWVVLPNEISGPGIYPEAVDTTFENSTDPLYSLEFWEGIINQPIILKGVMAGKCQQNSYFFNESTALVQCRLGNVTLGPSTSGLGITKGTLQGKYTGVHGVSACGQNVGFTAQKCEELA